MERAVIGETFDNKSRLGKYFKIKSKMSDKFKKGIIRQITVEKNLKNQRISEKINRKIRFTFLSDKI